MPYTCSSCGRYQQGHSADGICPASECQPARQAKAAAVVPAQPKRTPMYALGEQSAALVMAARGVERDAIVAWLRERPGESWSPLQLADRLELNEHRDSES